MPTYSYRCANCDHAFDQYQAFSDDSLTVCPNCHQSQLRKVFNSIGVTFNGSGFYRTDARAAAKATASKSSGSSGDSSSGGSPSGGSSSESSSKPSGDSKSSSKSSSKPSGDSKPASKPSGSPSTGS